MSLKQRLMSRLWFALFDRIATQRAPDFEVGPKDSVYLRRWWLIPRNPVLNLYLHQFRRSDDDCALHDHPWWNVSLLLSGSYVEHTIAAGGIEHRARRVAGDLKFRLGRSAHRIELDTGQCWTLFLTGPRFREWGFHCPIAGWVHWEAFTAPGAKGEDGRGCGEGGQ